MVSSRKAVVRQIDDFSDEAFTEETIVRSFFESYKPQQLEDEQDGAMSVLPLGSQGLRTSSASSGSADGHMYPL